MAKQTSSTYLVKLDADLHHRLKAKAALAGVSLAEATRVGTELYLDSLLDEQRPADPLLAEFRGVAARIESRIRGSWE